MTEERGEFIEYVVPESGEGLRADKVLADHFVDFSRMQVQESFKEGGVFLNGRAIKKNERVNAGGVLRLKLVRPEVTELRGVKIDLDVLYEDEYIIAINKASGMVTHPGKGTGEDTLVHALLDYTKGELSNLGGKDRPGVVHRLDKETTGIILFAKTDKAYLGLIKAFSNRELDKQYLALVSGSPHLDAGTIKTPIERSRNNRLKMTVVHEGREAHTTWKVEERVNKVATLLRCFLHTGRTHQIRVHLASIRHWILGDDMYGYRFFPGHVEKPPRILLHATRLSFSHPITQEEILIESPLPEDMVEQIRVMRGWKG